MEQIGTALLFGQRFLVNRDVHNQLSFVLDGLYRAARFNKPSLKSPRHVSCLSSTPASTKTVYHGKQRPVRGTVPRRAKFYTLCTHRVRKSCTT